VAATSPTVAAAAAALVVVVVVVVAAPRVCCPSPSSHTTVLKSTRLKAETLKQKRYKMKLKCHPMQPPMTTAKTRQEFRGVCTNQAVTTPQRLCPGRLQRGPSKNAKRGATVTRIAAGWRGSQVKDEEAAR